LNRGLTVFFVCYFCCGHVGIALRVVQAQRHLHSAIGSGLFGRVCEFVAGSRR
jgi:hypothetical protein